MEGQGRLAPSNLKLFLKARTFGSSFVGADRLHSQEEMLLGQAPTLSFGVLADGKICSKSLNPLLQRVCAKSVGNA